MCEQIISNLSSLYDSNSPYWSVINEVIQIYSESEKVYESLLLKVSELDKIGNSWDIKYRDCLKSIRRRDQYRRIFDHYDDKMQKLNKKKEEKAARSEIESPKQVEYYQRVKNI